MSPSKALLFLCLCVNTVVIAQNNTGINVQYSEAYELANVILALTPYGISDEWEVQKGTPYYEEVMTHFKFMQGHPLLEKANYSREKWEDYLSFRTDAFAFEVTGNGKIQRSFDFTANKGHQPFDDNLALIQDFYEKSRFHDFYQQHEAYFQSIAARYKDYFMVEIMQQFLEEEFGVFEANTHSLIVFSPLVNRMSCMRPINKSTSANFSTLALYLLLEGKEKEIDQAQRASDIHLLFTEMDHGYVNPISDQYAIMLAKNFKNKKWDNGSGYGGRACFNEYMTWAVYDLFILKYFPQYADQNIRNWHFVNNGRGFIASSFFGKKLQDLYVHRNEGQKIKDLYPALLNWTGSVGATLKSPELEKDTLTIPIGKIEEPISIAFSETLHKIPVVDCALFKMVDGNRQVIKTLELEAGKTLVVEDKTLKVNIPDLPKEAGLYGLSFNLYGGKYELTAENGVSVPSPTRVYIRVQ